MKQPGPGLTSLLSSHRIKSSGEKWIRTTRSAWGPSSEPVSMAALPSSGFLSSYEAPMIVASGLSHSKGNV